MGKKRKQAALHGAQQEQQHAAAAAAEEQPKQQKQRAPSSGDEAAAGSSSDGGGGGSGGSTETTSSSDGSSSGGPDVSDEPDDSDDPDAFDQIDVNFQFFDPKEADFHGLKALLHSYLDGQQYDSSGLVDAIIGQATVGTVVRTAEEDDPIAVMSVLNTQQHAHAGAGFMRQIQEHMLAHCSSEATKHAIREAWSSSATGLVINERLINCPPQLAPPLVTALFDEVAWATEDEPTQERRDGFKFNQYLLMTRVYTDPLTTQQGAHAAMGPPAAKPPKSGAKQQQQQQQPAKKQKTQRAAASSSGAGQAPVIVYVRPEDEFFHKHASASFTFPVEGRAVGKDELQPQRLVLLLPASKVTSARAALDAVVGNMAGQ